MVNLATAVNQRCVEEGITKAELCDRAGVSRSSLRRWLCVGTKQSARSGRLLSYLGKPKLTREALVLEALHDIDALNSVYTRTSQDMTFPSDMLITVAAAKLHYEILQTCGMIPTLTTQPDQAVLILIKALRDTGLVVFGTNGGIKVKFKVDGELVDGIYNVKDALKSSAMAEIKKLWKNK